MLVVNVLPEAVKAGRVVPVSGSVSAPALPDGILVSASGAALVSASGAYLVSNRGAV